MHRVPGQHRAVRHSNVQLDARDPSLKLGLPLPVNSIPVLGPVLSPLAGGNTPQPTASPNPNSGPNPNPNPNPSPSPSPTPPAGGNNGGNGGNTHGNGGGGTLIPTTPPVVLANGGGPGPAVPPSPVAPNPTSPAPAPGKSSPPGALPSATGVSIPNGNSRAPGSGNTPAVENVANPGSFATNAAGLGGSNPDASSTTGFPAPSQSLLHSGSHTGAASPQSTDSGTGGASAGKLLSGGAIAGIVILCLLFFLALIILIVRRRAIARRMELRKQWFDRSGPVGRLSFFNIAAHRGHVDSDADDRRSTRSSFATTYDQGLAFGADSPLWPSVDSVPGLPPMAQVHERNSVLMSTGGAAVRRESLNSMLDPDAQYLICSADHNISDLPSPMSVRPFSPSESFSFPKPPTPQTGNADYIASLRSSTTTLVNLAAPSRALATPPVQHQALIPSIAVPPSIVAPKNPFIDPFAASDPVKPEATDVEVVRRSFEPSLDDEVGVRPGDHVHVLRVFDDGWAFVEKFANTKRERSDKGLIPVDCLRDGDQTHPAFFAL